VLRGAEASVPPEVIAQDAAHEHVVGAHDVGDAIMCILGRVDVALADDVFDGEGDAAACVLERRVVELAAHVGADGPRLHALGPKMGDHRCDLACGGALGGDERRADRGRVSEGELKGVAGAADRGRVERPLDVDLEDGAGLARRSRPSGGACRRLLQAAERAADGVVDGPDRR